jgi:hypothetical protein
VSDQQKGRRRFVRLGVVLVVLAVHGCSLRNGFLYDDFHLFVENPAVIAHDWVSVWTSPSAASRDLEGRLNIRPITLSTYVWDHSMGGLRPAAYHATQLALHVLVVGLAFSVATALRLELVAAAAVALLVGIHPVQSEAVHYLAARSSVLSTLGLLASFWAYVTWRGGAGRWWLAGSVVALCAAVLSKESAVVGLVWFAAYELVMVGSSVRDTLRQLVPYVIAAGLAIVPYATLSGVEERVAAVATGTAVATGVAAVGRHLWWWFLPVWVEPVVPLRWVDWGDSTVWAGLAGLGLAGGAAVALRRRDPLISWGLLAGLSALAPVLALPFQTDVALFQPHRGYPASVGFAVAAVGLASLCGNRVIRQTASERARRVWRRAGVGVAAALLAAVVSVDAGLARSWRDEVTFWAVAVARYPGEAAYHQSLAAARLRAGDAPGAIDALSQALALDPELPRAAFNLGVAYTRLGRHDEAIAEFERAVVRDAADVKAWSNLGRLLELRGDATRALAAYRTALEIAPHLTAVRNRIAALETLRSTDRATTGRP